MLLNIHNVTSIFMLITCCKNQPPWQTHNYASWRFRLKLCRCGCAPSYLVPFIRVADLPSRRAVCSANTSRLIQPQSNRSTVGDRAFSVAGPQVWRLEQSATRGHISAITGHLSQASEDSSVHRVIFEHTTIVTD